MPSSLAIACLASKRRDYSILSRILLSISYFSSVPISLSSVNAIYWVSYIVCAWVNLPINDRVGCTSYGIML